jgi:hypothetical protein
LKILLGIFAIAVLLEFAKTVFVEPWIGKKIETAINKKNRDYKVAIDKVHVLRYYLFRNFKYLYGKQLFN